MCESEVLTSVSPERGDAASPAFAARQAQIAALFSGAAVQATSIDAPPPAMPAGGGKKQKKPTGC